MGRKHEEMLQGLHLARHLPPCAVITNASLLSEHDHSREKSNPYTNCTAKRFENKVEVPLVLLAVNLGLTITDTQLLFSHPKVNATDQSVVVNMQNIRAHWLQFTNGLVQCRLKQRVHEKDFGDGPFRWVVTQGKDGPVLGASRAFNLPGGANETVRVTVSPGP
jgi:hypothetical protein